MTGLSRWGRSAKWLSSTRLGSIRTIFTSSGDVRINNDVTNAFKGYRAYVIEGCRPFLSPHFNLTVEIPLKAIVRGYSYAVVPIGWRNRTAGRSSFHIQEMGSRYVYIILVVWLERLLTKNDYRRRSEEGFVPWPAKERTGSDTTR